MSDTNKNAKVLETQTIRDAFDTYYNMVVLDGIGQKNPDTGPTATTYSVFVTDEVSPVIDKVRTFVNNNWGSDADPGKVFAGCKNDADKLVMVPKIVADNIAKFEAPPKTVNPLRKAMENILAGKYANDATVSKLTGAALTKYLAPSVEAALVTANLERYRDQIDAELVAIANVTDKRSRKGEAAKETAPAILALD